MEEAAEGQWEERRGGDWPQVAGKRKQKCWRETEREEKIGLGMETGMRKAKVRGKGKVAKRRRR